MAIAEVLMVLGVDQTKASAASIPEDRFCEAFDELEILLGGPEVGFDLALDVVHQGDVLNYNGVKLEEYLGLARLVAGKLNYQTEQTGIFYSIESLRSYLSEKKERGLDFSKLKLARYRLLQDHPQSIRYLDVLIKSGELTIGDSEHWTMHKADGPRGGQICKSLGEQINWVYDDLELPRPRFKINHGQKKIIVNEETRGLLGQIKEYTSQR
nr:hypothetical protein [Nanoarchaeum sp.]